MAASVGIIVTEGLDMTPSLDRRPRSYTAGTEHDGLWRGPACEAPDAKRHWESFEYVIGDNELGPRRF